MFRRQGHLDVRSDRGHRERQLVSAKAGLERADELTRPVARMRDGQGIGRHPLHVLSGTDEIVQVLLEAVLRTAPRTERLGRVVQQRGCGDLHRPYGLADLCLIVRKRGAAEDDSQPHDLVDQPHNRAVGCAQPGRPVRRGEEHRAQRGHRLVRRWGPWPDDGAAGYLTRELRGQAPARLGRGVAQRFPTGLGHNRLTATSEAAPASSQPARRSSRHRRAASPAG